jgi:hypothetical protein
MTHASVRGPWAGRLLALLFGFLFVTGMTLTPSRAADSAKPAEPAKPPVIASKDASVGEMVQVINEKLTHYWRENKLKASDVCSDYEFIRRASLDIIGRIAKPEEIERFNKDPQGTRRALLIDRLLASEEYPKNWANIWANWLLTRSGPFGRGDYHDQTQVWLEDQFAQNKPFNETVTALVTAKGSNKENGAVNFILAHLGEATPRDKRSEEGAFEMVPITSRTTRLFLGVQTQCTQCHDHPFDAKLKQNQFWGVNAFFRQVERKGDMAMRMRDSKAPLELVVNTNLNPQGFVSFEKRNGLVLVTTPVFIDGTKVSDIKTDRREDLARFIVNHDNFPRALVNRMWAHFMGRGFTNPVDDFNEQNQPSMPDLLDDMAKKFKHYGFDQKKLVRWICNSQAYSLSTVANKSNDKSDAEPFFSRMLLKAMSPEQLFESLITATKAEAAETRDGRKALRTRWMDNLISNFGDDEGNEVTFNGTVVQALLMMNGKDINDAIVGPKGSVAKMVTKYPGGSAQTYINYLYLVTLNRMPTARELAGISKAMPMPAGEKYPVARWHDLMWALLNSNEFILNH